MEGLPAGPPGLFCLPQGFQAQGGQGKKKKLLRRAAFWMKSDLD